MTQYHNSVLLKEALQGLKIKPEGIYVDVTFGGGGHSRAILEELNSEGKLFGFDQDADASKNALKDDRFTFVAANFSHLAQYLKFYKVSAVDGILADFGVSSHQFDKGSRGFSIRKEGRLDMLMNQSQILNAYQVLNEYSSEQLAQIFSQFGELRNAKKIANKLVEVRYENNIETTTDLIKAVKLNK